MRNLKGLVLERGEEYYTDLEKVFRAINNIHTEFNWLITDCCAYPEDERINELLLREYCFLSGSELDEIVKSEDFQLIWGVLSGFKKEVSLEEVMKYNFPYADGNGKLWENPVSIQHPLAEIEIISWDGDKTLIISKDEKIVSDFRKSFSLSEDLEIYNERLEKNT